MKKTAIAFFTGLLLFSFMLNATQSGTQYLFVFDASGSMWQKIDNEFKITIAKSVLKELVQKLPDDARLGLVAYGHNREGDCNDIETLVPIGPADKAAFNKKVDALNPKGKTPIALSVNHVLSILRTESLKHTTIILISDGLETCEGNACETMKNAKAAGVNITTHVIGFGISESDISELECLAQAGGGMYLPANNAQELNEVLNQVTVEPVLGGGYLSVKAMLNEELIDALVLVFKKGQTEDIASGRTYTGKETNPRVLLLPAGEYDVEVKSVRLEGSPKQILKGLVIAANDTLKEVVSFSKGTIKVAASRNGEISDALVQLMVANSKETVANKRTYNSKSSNPVVFEVLPGTYDIIVKSVEIEDSPVKKFDNIVLKGDTVLNFSHNFTSGTLKVGAKQGSALVDATITVYSTKDSKSSVAAGRTYVSASSNPKTFILEPGNYEVKLGPVKPKGLPPKNMQVTIKENGTTEIWGEW